MNTTTSTSTKLKSSVSMPSSEDREGGSHLISGGLESGYQQQSSFGLFLPGDLDVQESMANEMNQPIRTASAAEAALAAAVKRSTTNGDSLSGGNASSGYSAGSSGSSARTRRNTGTSADTPTHHSGLLELAKLQESPCVLPVPHVDAQPTASTSGADSGGSSSNNSDIKTRLYRDLPPTPSTTSPERSASKMHYPHNTTKCTPVRRSNTTSTTVASGSGSQTSPTQGGLPDFIPFKGQSLNGSGTNHPLERQTFGASSTMLSAQSSYFRDPPLQQFVQSYSQGFDSTSSKSSTLEADPRPNALFTIDDTALLQLRSQPPFQIATPPSNPLNPAQHQSGGGGGGPVGALDPNDSPQNRSVSTSPRSQVTGVTSSSFDTASGGMGPPRHSGPPSTSVTQCGTHAFTSLSSADFDFSRQTQSASSGLIPDPSRTRGSVSKTSDATGSFSFAQSAGLTGSPARGPGTTIETLDFNSGSFHDSASDRNKLLYGEHTLLPIPMQFITFLDDLPQDLRKQRTAAASKGGSGPQSNTESPTTPIVEDASSFIGSGSSGKRARASTTHLSCHHAVCCGDTSDPDNCFQSIGSSTEIAETARLLNGLSESLAHIAIEKRHSGEQPAPPSYQLSLLGGPMFTSRSSENSGAGSFETFVCCDSTSRSSSCSSSWGADEVAGGFFSAVGQLSDMDKDQL